MQARKLTVRVEPDESVAAVYARDLEAVPDALFVRMGALHLTGRPADVVAVLESAVHECLKAWASGYANEAGGGQDGAPRYGNGNFHVVVSANSPSVSRSRAGVTIDGPSGVDRSLVSPPAPDRDGA